jgi:hypothetical protein
MIQMRHSNVRSLALSCVIGVLAPVFASQADVPSHDAFAYQGQLRQSGEPATEAVDLKFRLYDAEVAGEQVGDELVAAGYDDFDDEGRFTIDLAFGKGVFDGTALWLEIEVDGVTLSPRQPIMPTPYSVRALNVATVADDALGGTYTGQLNFNNAGNQFTGAFAGSGTGLTDLNASNISSGTLGSTLLSGSYTNAVSFGNPNNAFNGLFNGSGSGLTQLNATNISFGNLNPARMPVGGNWSLSSTLNLASNTLVVNPSLGRIGIGTSTPRQHLSIGAHLDLYSGSLNSPTRPSVRGSANDNLILSAANDGDVYFNFDGGSGGVRFHGGVGVGLLMRLTPEGELGIGISDPDALLHVHEGTSGMGLILPGLRVFQNDESPNVIGGFSGNEVGADVVGATIGGGGRLSNDQINRVLGSYGSISGGRKNTASGHGSTVGGGFGNTASDNFSTVGGGGINSASGGWSTVVGGYDNYATELDSVVGGGAFNTASGIGSIVPGGQLNEAGGLFSFAAGRRAKVRTAAQAGNAYGDQGTFIWADSTDANFTSTGNNQFLIRAGGGVGIGTNAPGAAMHIVRASSGSVPQMRVESSTDNGFARVRMNTLGQDAHWDISAGGSNNILDFWRSDIGTMMILRGDTQSVGIRTGSPSFTLHVNGTAGKPGGGSWSNASDIRLKHNIQPLSHSLDRLLALDGVTYEYIDPDSIHELPGERIGMIAQQVAEVFPDWVNEADDGYLRLTYRGFEAVVVEALRELRNEKDAEIAALHDRIERLEALLEIALGMKEASR